MAAGYDVVVVGGGIGGLTVAALLAARGLGTCVLERQSQVGGCIGRVEFSGQEFEPGMGVYTSFGTGEIYERIFAELPVDIPHTSLVTQPYVVRLADGTDVRLVRGDGFFDELAAAFPECADRAIEFYRNLEDLRTALGARTDLNALQLLSGTSPRFRSFIDLQLRGFLHTSLDHCSAHEVAAALARPREPLYTIDGGPVALAEQLADSIRRSGGTVRLNAPVLRLAYDQSGVAIGVDLLSGERQIATKAIVSNLTIWDTYGKLVGLNRTLPEIKKQLNALSGTGAYVVYATIDEPAVRRLPGERMLVATSPTESDDDRFSEIALAVFGPTITLKSATDVNDWFTYHASEEDFEATDQAALEHFWTKLHGALPELGSGVEIIETANPRTYYDQTRRKLGMVLGLQPAADVSPTPQPPSLDRPSHSAGGQFLKISSPEPILPNLFVVGDTASPFPDLSSVAQTALSLANTLKRNR